jgi:hypothetical protein
MENGGNAMSNVTLKNVDGVLHYFVDGVETDQAAALAAAASDPVVNAAKNHRTLLDRFAGWLVDNQTYIDSVQGATTNARLNDLEVQVKKLSRQNKALLRIIGKQLDSAD